MAFFSPKSAHRFKGQKYQNCFAVINAVKCTRIKVCYVFI